MITVEDACREIQSEHPDKQYELDHLIRTLNGLGGVHFICTQELWECYGKKKFYNKLLQMNDKTKNNTRLAIDNYF